MNNQERDEAIVDLRSRLEALEGELAKIRGAVAGDAPAHPEPPKDQQPEPPKEG